MKALKNKTLLAASIATLLSLPAAAAEPLRMVLEVNANDFDSVKSQLVAQGIQINRELSDLDSLAITLDKSQLGNVSALKGIQAFYPDMPRKLMSEGSTQFIPYGLPMVQGDQVSYQGGQKVCVIDSGYGLSHPDLPSAAVTGAEDGGAGVWYEDPFGHGTHVAGTIAAVNNDIGTVGLVSDHSLDMHIVRVFAGNGAWAYASDLAHAINECEQAGANIISMSLGGTFSSPLEERAIAKTARNNVLMIAAAGNSGQPSHSYPASYDSVVSVAAIDSSKGHASFSQRTSQVELSAPGVDVFSTVPQGRGARFNKFNVVQDGLNVLHYSMENSGIGSVTGELVDCGLGTESCGDVTGKICLMERGQIPFFQKVDQCEADGGVGVIVRNNMPGKLIPMINPTDMIAGAVTYQEGQLLMDNLGKETTISSANFPDHDLMSGTSMATPHVSGVAALVWSNFPECSANGIRMALRASAQDLGESGYDYAYGWGLVQAKDAVDYLKANGCQVPKGNLKGGQG
ncbi:S8 family serine peptidase [Pseudoalteromonas sp. T1lg88]|uniref:S8 family serine peptidase n=1 Tax=Pseudoalteromonas sp. T1lg88 TaxID=2077104 RepID=UPI001319F618|nr:S8 family serine peptidase [Pseudoalteromonas sp. T1lg88]